MLFLFTWIFDKTLYTIVIIPIDEDLEENYEEYFPRQKKEIVCVKMILFCRFFFHAVALVRNHVQFLSALLTKDYDLLISERFINERIHRCLYLNHTCDAKENLNIVLLLLNKKFIGIINIIEFSFFNSIHFDTIIYFIFKNK